VPLGYIADARAPLIVQLFKRHHLALPARQAPCHLPWQNGMIHGMTLQIDKSGRIVVPKRIRQRLGWKPGAELEVSERPEGILLRRPERQPSMVQVDGLWVHQGVAEPGTDWDRVVEDSREERLGRLIGGLESEHLL
jgi:AbrB family looped-hinge helix DNA binding protein